MKFRFLKDWFSFSRGERRGAIFLASLLVLLLLIPLFLRYCSSPKVADANVEQLREYASYVEENMSAQPIDTVRTETSVKPSAISFTFDPNTIARDSLLLLGFSPKQSDAIIKYRERGSGFRTPADFLKLNVITERQRERLQPFVSVNPTLAKKSSFQRDTFSRTTSYSRPLIMVELNTADTALLRTLPGIGAYSAKKIVDYREALGGYVAIEQLLEINNFGQERLQKLESRITVDLNKVQRFELKEENMEVMRKHPYVGAYAARGIVQYVKRKGVPVSIDELSNNNIITSLQARKLQPYVK